MDGYKAVAWVLKNSGSICENYKDHAPFIKSDFDFYLKAHHLRHLTDGSSNTVTNAVEVFPSYQKELHYAENRDKALGMHLSKSQPVDKRVIFFIFKIIPVLLTSLLPLVAVAQVMMPENAKPNVYGNGWVCSNGFKKFGNTCKKMTPEEAEQQRIQMQIMVARAASREFYVDDEEFTLSEVSRKCEVYRYSDNYGDVECSGSKFRVIERKCEAYFSGKFEKSGELDCQGGDLRSIERYCSTTMYSDSYGDIDC